MSCKQLNTVDYETKKLIDTLGNRGNKVSTLIGILKSIESTDPEFFSSLSRIEDLKGAEKSIGNMLKYITGGTISSVDDYRVLKDREKIDGQNYTANIDLMIDFKADELIEDMHQYGDAGAKWFSVVQDKAMHGWIQAVRRGSDAGKISNTVTSIMNFQNDNAVLFPQCPLIDSVRKQLHDLQDIIVGGTKNFNIAYNDYVQWISTNFKTEGIYVVNKYMKYMDQVNANYNSNGSGGDFRIVRSEIANDNNIKDKLGAMKCLIASRDYFWENFNYGSKDRPAGNHFTQMASIDGAIGSFALYQKQIGSSLSGILMDALKTHGFKPSDLSETQWDILSRFANEAEIKPYLEAYNKYRADNGQSQKDYNPYQLRIGYIPNKVEGDEFFGMFKDYANISQWKASHKAEGDFLTALADQINGLNYSPTAMAEELNIKIMDNIVNGDKSDLSKDYQMWKSQRISTSEKLEKHIEKIYSIVAYHKDTISDKAKAKVQQYRKLAEGLAMDIDPLIDKHPEASTIRKNWAMALSKLSGIEGNAKDARFIEQTVKTANKYVSILEKQLSYIDPKVDKKAFYTLQNKVAELRSLQKESADFDYNSINMAVSRMDNLVKQFDKIKDPGIRQDFISRGRSILTHLETIQSDVNNASSVFERKQIYKDANLKIEKAINNMYYLDKTYGGLTGRADAEYKRFIARSEFILSSLKDTVRREKISTEYMKESKWYDPTTWISTKTVSLYISTFMTNMLKNSAMSNFVGATTSAMSLSPGGKQIVLARQYSKNRKHGSVMSKRITDAVEQASSVVSGATKEQELFDTSTMLTAEQKKFSWEYIKGIPSLALQRNITNNMQSGPMSGVRTLFNIFGKDPKWMKMEGIAGLLTMAGSEGCLIVRGFSKAMIDSSVRSRIALIENAGGEVKPEDVDGIARRVLNEEGALIRQYMNVTRGRFTKDNKSVWGYGMADMARTRPEVFKGMLLTTALAFKQPMAFASNAFAKATFRTLFGVGYSIGSRSFAPLQGAGVMGVIMGASTYMIKNWLFDDEDDEKPGMIETAVRSTFFSPASQSLLPTDAFQSDWSIVKVAVSMFTGSACSQADYEKATNMVSRIPGPVWDGLWKVFIDDVMAGEVTDQSGWFVDMTPDQYATFVSKRVGLLNVDDETSNIAIKTLMHIGNMGYRMKDSAEGLLDFPLMAASHIFGEHDFQKYFGRSFDLKQSVNTNLPFVGNLFGKTNDHVAGMVRMINYLDLMLSIPESGKDSWLNKVAKESAVMALAPIGLNGYIPAAIEYRRNSFQISAVSNAIRKNHRYTDMQVFDYSKEFHETIDRLYESGKHKESDETLEELLDDSEE